MRGDDRKKPESTSLFRIFPCSARNGTCNTCWDIALEKYLHFYTSEWSDMNIYTILVIKQHCIKTKSCHFKNKKTARPVHCSCLSSTATPFEEEEKTLETLARKNIL